MFMYAIKPATKKITEKRLKWYEWYGHVEKGRRAHTKTEMKKFQLSGNTVVQFEN